MLKNFSMCDKFKIPVKLLKTKVNVPINIAVDKGE